MASNLLGSASRLIKNYHFWVLVVMFILGIIFHYPQEIFSTDSPSLIPFPGATRHAAERILFLLPITYAGYFLGIRAGLASMVISLAVMLPRVFLVSLYPIDSLFETGGVIIVGGLVNVWFLIHRRDIAQRRRAEEILARIVDGSPIPTFVINKQHRVIHWNRALESLSGINREVLVGTDSQWKAFYANERPVMADLIVDGASYDAVEALYQGKFQKSSLIEGAYEAEDFFPALGSSGKWLQFTASPIRDSNGEIAGAVETLQDVSEKQGLYENLNFYLQEITRAQEEERKRISRELHDSIAQNLIALLRQLENFLTGGKLRAQEIKTLSQFYDGIREVSQEVRRFSRDLRPSVIDDLGLLPALEWLGERLHDEHGLEVKLDVTGNTRRLPKEAELLLFRIVQEALRNTTKHARASKVEVNIGFSESKITIVVSDDGIGFRPPANLSALAPEGKLGLAGIQERVKLLGGNLRLESERGKGTTVSIEAPI